MRELRFKKIDRNESARREREVRGLVEMVKASTEKGTPGITPRFLLKTLFGFNRKAADALVLIDGMIAGDGPSIPSESQKAAFLALRPIFAAILSVAPYKPGPKDDA